MLVIANSREEIRTAYKRESLKTHPDKLSPKASAEERRRYTERFVSPQVLQSPTDNAKRPC